mmetsp:Transcript_37992/g.34022  ORF Transcript_37992/g.34022 Transcript_37992/m.34022 type:complete len:345 (+) Transcript_37992:43-1077(+)|eukprot:CAMPEP_0114585760 /NCGR_PEP_ID=MMETSP0125-20121206/9203_1 /TAXON_ID=485358 ORGANISM="Aristerostoma sp., Strain ATCC 50986" /NCGR_SAMPLE_ID=MMETSP0125 /ASSEMBLY_ACC=CAM_ASM_000245 /LENGTH=344 /DNA_ID=CAMNT_0001780959 /DNA_START=32 /DNA_END=1066 /DNA_ORIENTATION=-
MQKNFSGFPGDCSEEQLQVLEKLRNEVKAMGLDLNKYDDQYLLRFCRARKFKFDKVLEMWKKFVKWRQENNVDNINEFELTELSQIRPFYPHGYFRTDKKGRPIYIERIGLFKVAELFKITSQERMVKYYIKSYEKLVNVILPQCTKASGHRVDQTVTILDLKGASFKMFSGQVIDFVKLASSIGQDYYPEIMGQMFIVNAPMLFSGAWAVIKQFLDEKTRQKIKIIGSSYQKELLECIDAGNLPDFLGGKVPESEYGKYLENEQGPWVGLDEQTYEGNEEAKNDDEDQAQDINDLKKALAGMNFGGVGGEKKKKKNPYDDDDDNDVADMGGQKFYVNDTPLNT